MSDNYHEDLRKILNNYLENTTSDWNYITPEDFYHEFFKKGKNFFLLDIRAKKDYDKYHIKGAQNIYWKDILQKKNIDKLPKDKHIFIICYVGHTSSQILVLLKLLGYAVTSIKFGYGISPVFEVPVAGWINYNYPTV